MADSLRPAYPTAMLATIRAVSFDVGGTLIEPWPSVGAVYAAAAARHGLPDLDPAQLTQRFLAAWHRRSGKFAYTRTAWAEVVGETFANREAGQNPAFFGDLYTTFGQPATWHVFDDVRSTLASLRLRGFRLAVISNWDERLRPLLARLGLAAYFDTIIVSGEFGVHKPAPAIFQAAARRLQLPPACLLHIGDNEGEDRQGAIAAGLAAVRLARDGQGEERLGMPLAWVRPQLGADGLSIRSLHGIM